MVVKAAGTGHLRRTSAPRRGSSAPKRHHAAGTVERATGWRRDHGARSSSLGLIYMMVEGAVREIGGPGFILGNHVTIRGDDGSFATAAHLQRCSIAVRIGDTVDRVDGLPANGEHLITLPRET